jgi:CHRD domain
MHVRVKLAAAVGATAALAIAVTTAVAGDGDQVKARLTGFEEVPVNSTVARGDFRAQLRVSQSEIQYRLRYSDLEGTVQVAHIHLGQRSVNGGVAVFLCSNMGGAPAGTPACPPPPATVEGTIGPEDIVGPAAQGLVQGEFDELVRAIRAGVTYANVHSSKFPNGEIRGQISSDDGDD